MRLLSLSFLMLTLPLVAQSPTTRTDRTLCLDESDLVWMIRSGQTSGKIQLLSERILVVNHFERRITAFDSCGRLIAGVNLESLPSPDPQFLSRMESKNHDLLVENDRLFFSSGDTLYIWDLKGGRLVGASNFGERVMFLRALRRTLLLATPEGESPFLTSDYQGNVLFTWGRRIVEPESPFNRWANHFQAVSGSDHVVVFFTYYPKAHVYDHRGNLLEELEYELPPTVRRGYEEKAPRLADLDSLAAEPEETYPLIQNVKAYSGKYLVIFNGFLYGELDESFRLSHAETISDPERGYFPRVIDIDPERGRLLVRTVEPENRDLPILERISYRFQTVGERPGPTPGPYR